MICLTTPGCPSAAGRIEFLSFSSATGLQKLNFRVADDSSRIVGSVRGDEMTKKARYPLYGSSEVETRP
jgi:hypothetical protein